MSDTQTFDAWDPHEAADRAGTPPPASGIAPLERFVAPPHVDGSAGTHRCNDSCKIGATHDQAAIEWWVMQTSDNEATAKSRRSAMDKLLNWACLARGKAVSSLDEDDFAAFAGFLAHPEPMQQWVGIRQPRESDAWRPFTRRLTGSSRVAVLRQTQSLVGWLSLQRYADLRFCYGKTAMDDGLATVPFIGTGRTMEATEQIAIAEWHWIRRAMDLHFPPEDLAPQRLIIEMLYYGNMNVEEVAKLEKRNFEPPNRMAPGWAISLTNRPGWRGGHTVFSPPPLSQTVARWMRQRETPRDGYVMYRIRDSVDTLLELDGERVGRHARQALRLAASLALDSGDVGNGMRLRSRSVVNLRGAFAAHQRKDGVDRAAIALTGRTVKFGADIRQRLASLWDWRDAEHLWTENHQVRAFDASLDNFPSSESSRWQID
jgi:hypothetical protein